MAELAPHLPRQLDLQREYVQMSLKPTSTLTPRARTAIYELWAKNIGHLVKGTSMDDDEPTKREEMFDPTMRFILLLRDTTSPPDKTITAGPALSDNASAHEQGSSGGKSKKKKKKPEKVDFGQDDLLGYCSFRFDMEETLDDEREIEVIYCYELQLSNAIRGNGLGRLLVTELEEIGRKRGMQKSMLTCMRCNQDALRFYNRSGYEADEIDPLRMMGQTDPSEEYTAETSGSEIDYRILSKSLV